MRFAALLLLASAAFGQEAITLDAADKHIVRAAYHDDKAIVVSGNDAGGWHLYAGAAIDAQQIDLHMRNVRGVVHFRADASRVTALIERSRRSQLMQRLH